ncbi:MAG: DUF4349 domain-containing protein [Actinomycetia bacterium]|nr:DUF4349 domain-containing protein [Actinomycetes bacterium]
MNTARRSAGVAAALALIALTACGDDKKSADYEQTANTTTGVDEALAPEAGDGRSISGGGEATDSVSPELGGQPQSSPIPDVVTDPSRKLVITMTVSIEVTEAANAVDQVIALAARHGGQLYDSQLDLNDPKTASGDLVFKLPPDEVQLFLNGLDPAIGRRTGLDGTTSDVTTQITDLDAQILAAEASVDRVRVLLEGATNLDDVIRLETEFTSRQTHLEQLRAQQNTLDGLVALATITVHLTTAPPIAATNEVGNLSKSLPDKGVGAAFKKGWAAFLAVLVAIALFVGYTAPFLVLGGLALLIVWRVSRRVSRRPQQSNVPARPPQPSVANPPNHPTPVG